MCDYYWSENDFRRATLKLSSSFGKLTTIKLKSCFLKHILCKRTRTQTQTTIFFFFGCTSGTQNIKHSKIKIKTTLKIMIFFFYLFFWNSYIKRHTEFVAIYYYSSWFQFRNSCLRAFISIWNSINDFIHSTFFFSA